VRDRHQPILGFNLHDQDRRTMVGDSGRLATIALLAVAGDPQGTMSEGRLRAKRIAAGVVAALQPLIGASIARYDEDWSPRAFGDNITAWGTPVVLIESGGMPAGRPLSDLTGLNFVALLSVLSSLAADDAAAHDPALYERLTRNREDAYADVVLRGGRILQGAGGLPYRGDLAFNVYAPDTREWGCPGVPDSGPSRIAEIGDLRFVAAGREIDAAGKLIVPALVASVRGLGARWWLTPRALDDLGRLGVGHLRWHVPLTGVGQALAIVAERAAAGRPAITVVGAKEAASLLVLTRAPRAPRTRSLADVLDALGTWRSPRRPFADAFPLLTAPPAAPPAPIRLTRDAPASLLVLGGVDDSAFDPDVAQVESVFIDGREVAAPGARPR
jgi:hypothetical protein